MVVQFTSGFIWWKDELIMGISCALLCFTVYGTWLFGCACVVFTSESAKTRRVIREHFMLLLWIMRIFISFEKVFIGELEGSLGKGERNLVAVKHLLRNATDKDK